MALSIQGHNLHLLDYKHREALLQLATQDPQAWSAKLWEQSLEREEVHGLFSTEQLIGVLVLGSGYLEIEILYLLVAQAWQRQGIGQQLLQKAIQKAKAKQAERLILEVRASNTAAHSLYHAVGFKTLGLRKSYYTNQEDALVMALNVTH